MYRSCIGALQWLVTIARPDLACATNTLAKASNRDPTKAMANACRKALRYVAGTLDYQISYSPETEVNFYKLIKDIEDHPDSCKLDK